MCAFLEEQHSIDVDASAIFANMALLDMASFESPWKVDSLENVECRIKYVYATFWVGDGVFAEQHWFKIFISRALATVLVCWLYNSCGMLNSPQMTLHKKLRTIVLQVGVKGSSNSSTSF